MGLTTICNMSGALHCWQYRHARWNYLRDILFSFQAFDEYRWSKWVVAVTVCRCFGICVCNRAFLFRFVPYRNDVSFIALPDLWKANNIYNTLAALCFSLLIYNPYLIHVCGVPAFLSRRVSIVICTAMYTSMGD